MISFGNLRKIFEAGNKSGLSREKMSAVINGELFSKAEQGFLGMLRKSMKESKNRGRLLDVLENKSEQPFPLHRIFGFFEKFSGLKGQISSEITPEDIKFMSFVVVYMEEWFYRADWSMKGEKGVKDEFAYFSVPAGILNLFTKILEIPAYKNGVEPLDLERINDLVRNVEDYFFSSVYQKKVISLLSERDLSPQQREVVNYWVRNFQKIKDSFVFSRNSVVKELGEYGHPESVLYFMKTCLVAASILARHENKLDCKGLFLPDLTVFDKANQYLMYDFSHGQDPKTSSMHYPTHRIFFAIFAVLYLRNSKNKA